MTSSRSLVAAVAVILLIWPPLLVVHDHARLSIIYLLAALGLYLLVRCGWDREDRTARILLFTILAACLAALLALVMSPSVAAGRRDFEAIYTPLLLIFPIFFLFQRCRPAVGWLWWGGVLGSLVIGALTLQELGNVTVWEWGSLPRLVQPDYRVSGGVYPTLWGMLSSSMLLLTLGGYSHFKRGPIAARVIWGAAVLLALFSCLMTGTRTAWLGVLLALLPVVVVFLQQISMRMRAAVFVIGIAALFGLVRIPYLQDRLALAVMDVQSYQQNSATSLGLRFEMWRAALLISSEHPLFGTGFGQAAYAQEVARLAEEKRVDGGVGQFVHSHNEFLYALATRGIPGALALFAVYLLFPFLFFRAWRSAPGHLQAVAVTGLMISIAYVAYGLADVPSVFRITAIPYALLMGTLLGLSYPAKEVEATMTARVHPVGANGVAHLSS